MADWIGCETERGATARSQRRIDNHKPLPAAPTPLHPLLLPLPCALVPCCMKSLVELDFGRAAPSTMAPFFPLYVVGVAPN